MTADEQRLAEALAIQRLYGEEGHVWIASRIGALALAGDTPGVERFREIAAEYEKLLTAARQ